MKDEAKTVFSKKCIALTTYIREHSLKINCLNFHINKLRKVTQSKWMGENNEVNMKINKVEHIHMREKSMKPNLVLKKDKKND